MMTTRTSAPDVSEVERTLDAARKTLLSARVPAGHWEGRLSSSALSTATAACALEMVRRNRADRPSDLEPFVRNALRWLAGHQNADGGFGDTAASPSNVSTTTLCWAALGLRHEETKDAFARAEAWLLKDVGDLAPRAFAATLGERYGKDRTFAVPILTMCALAGRFGEGREAWRPIPRLPFELAALPHSWFKGLNLRVVSYALPALIAIGQALHHHHPTRNPFARAARGATRGRTLRILEAIQPASGGFLEAAPLTSFVTMNLAGAGHADHPVTRKGAGFLTGTVREDGSWPIDTNLATWVTTLSVQALAAGGGLPGDLDREAVGRWLLGQQYREEHPYTHAAPGGWAWTDLPGGVPDADDTPGALLALRALGAGDVDAARGGVEWLLDLQNKDGGIPTFCRGWGKLPFDQSCPDLTAHALRAWDAWKPDLPRRLQTRVHEAAERGYRYLVDTQREDGTWVPLWFGNQHGKDQANPLYGTSRVLLTHGSAGKPKGNNVPFGMGLERAVEWMTSIQNEDGGFGGAAGAPSTIEETALAVEALSDWYGDEPAPSVARGVRWLLSQTEGGTRFDPSPIGLYFARLWYDEMLYPVIFSVAALGRVLQNLRTP